ncbi:hypothetical protein BDF20DRAFT_871780 [Mycotypha africana]|uniref:uncharacterized protein n=1 Tax=Mycotypha africana TaxID=64632 RepID=UPI0023005818|nr:uncharacterized protein BDF20DRAFT_871780 [Mycotypha africana]KAI8979805.1 hypothetical protein BDF20DRAFT_871780 [Mycotypha africana]
MMEHPYSLPPRLTEKQKKKKENCNTIHCICDTPHEEFGSMVQCDDCYHWLHVECLELDDEALGEEEPFRCPLCFLSMGNIYKDGKRNAKNPKMLSSITWRYAAQWKSRLLADSARYNHHSTDDEYDDDDDDDDMIMDDVCTFAHPLEVDENFTVQHPSPLSQPFTSTSTAPLTADTTVLAPFTLPPSPLTPINYIPPQLQPFEAAATAAATTSFMTQTVNEEDDNSSTAEDLTTGPVTPTSTDWPDISSESRYSISSQDSLSTISSVCTSEVTTPTTEFYSSSALTAAAALAAASSTSTTGGGGVYASDPFDVKEMNQLLFNQTVESLEILHQLVYLESSLLHNRPPKVFSPHASDVFLCGDNLAKDSTTTAFTLPSTSMMTHEKTPSTPSTPSILPSSKASITAPPSDVCSQDLSEYSFDSGPFWSPLY